MGDRTLFLFIAHLSYRRLSKPVPTFRLLTLIMKSYYFPGIPCCLSDSSRADIRNPLRFLPR